MTPAAGPPQSDSPLPSPRFGPLSAVGCTTFVRAGTGFRESPRAERRRAGPVCLFGRSSTMSSNSRGKLSRNGARASSTPRHRRRAQPKLERLEDRSVPASFRTIDGTGNNAANPEWGSAGVDLLRKADAAYIDGLSDPTVDRPSAREISNVIVAQTTPERVISERFMSAMIYGWGQFL